MRVWEWRSTELLGLSNVELMEAMTQSTEAIKSLGLLFGYRANIQTEIAHVFTATAKFLPDVEELTIWVKFWKDNTHGLKWSLKELSESLSSFRKLCALDFNGSTGWGEPYFDHRRNAISTVYTRILQNWSERCPTLKKVTFPNGTLWIKEPVLIRSKYSKYWPLSFLRTTSPSVPRQRINAMLQGVEDALSVDFIPGDTLGSDSIFTQGDLSGHPSNIEITTAANLPSPKPPAHTDLNQTTRTGPAEVPDKDSKVGTRLG
ncbi:hypothetical protein FRC05_004269 [Tulasnella sp. 425]|nr:hypothetical protein FRC05_004269 [Tulasnella sp. 425]